MTKWILYEWSNVRENKLAFLFLQEIFTLEGTLHDDIFMILRVFGPTSNLDFWYWHNPKNRTKY